MGKVMAPQPRTNWLAKGRPRSKRFLLKPGEPRIGADGAASLEEWETNSEPLSHHLFAFLP
jgi:hypothetical protein